MPWPGKRIRFMSMSLVETGLAAVLVCWLMFGAPSPARAEQDPVPSRSGGASKSLQAKASDPTEPLVQVSIFNDLVLGSRGGTGLANQLLIQPVIPIPRLNRFPVGQIIRPSIPIITSPGPDRTTGVGDISRVDIFLPGRYEWGAGGSGPVFVFPTAIDDRLGQGKWQMGPPPV